MAISTILVASSYHFFAVSSAVRSDSFRQRRDKSQFDAWPVHLTGGYCTAGFVGGVKFSSQSHCQDDCESKDACNFYCHGSDTKQWDCLQYSRCPDLEQQLKDWSMVGYSCYQKPRFNMASSRSVQDSSDARSKAVISVPSGQDSGEYVQGPPTDPAQIQNLMSRINDTCNQVDEVLSITNDTMYRMLDELHPSLDGALGVIEKAKIAAEAADMFGVTDTGTFITHFADVMSGKVSKFQAKLEDSTSKVLNDLATVHERFLDIRANVVEKFGDALEQVSDLVQVVVNISRATQVAIAAARQTGILSLRRAQHQQYLQDIGSISKDDWAVARAMVNQGKVIGTSAGTLGSGDFSEKVITNVKAAIDGAKQALQPLASAIQELYDKLANGLVGQVLDFVEEGVAELNHTAAEAVDSVSSALPGIIRDQMGGLFGGVLDLVGQVTAQIESTLQAISIKLDEANSTQASLLDAANSMSELVDEVSPIFTGFGTSSGWLSSLPAFLR